ncbi:tetratricopeptide repeat (TPR)-like superfamily protein [Wolffia australiana]
MIRSAGNRCGLQRRFWFPRRAMSSRVMALGDEAKRLSEIMVSCPKTGLEVALDGSGVWMTPDLAEQVLRRFENAGMLAYKFFEWAGKQRNYSHSVKAYHTMIGSLAKIRQYQIMWQLVDAMRGRGMLNIETFCVIMRNYARAKKTDEAIYTFNVMDKHGVAPNLAAFNGLLSALCKSKNVRRAQQLFDEMSHRFAPDSKTFSILIQGWGKEPNLPKARELYGRMIEGECEPDEVTYGIMVDVLAKAGRVEEAVGIVKEMESRACPSSSFVYSALIHAYGAERRLEEAVAAFLDMERAGVRPDVAACNALVGAFCRASKLDMAMKVVGDMERKKGVVPNARTCNILLNGLISAGETDRAYAFFRKMIPRCEPDSDTYTMMIKMFCAGGRLDRALKVWKFMERKQFIPSMHTFSALVNGLCSHGEVERACALLEEMLDRGIRPPGSTFGKLRQLLLKRDRSDVLRFLTEKMNLLIKEPLCD